jgi:hypothetical protein
VRWHVGVLASLNSFEIPLVEVDLVAVPLAEVDLVEGVEAF